MKNASEYLTKYLSNDFIRQFTYNGNDLGAICQPDATDFRIWSPLASLVILNLYESDDINESPYKTYVMPRSKKGTWHKKIAKNLHGVFYDYAITIDHKTTITIDPYAYSAGRNGKRGAIIDFSQIGPAGWADDTAPQIGQQTIIYETHIAEFSAGENGGWPDSVKGKYLALATPGTMNSAGQPTGLEHVAKLGITHIQLMPIFDYGSVDETDWFKQFNWGYDPLNYNLPEGSFSSDPSDPLARVAELQSAIQAIHNHGMRVVMDVVYNHTFNLDNSLMRVAPYYFYRLTPDGYLSNGSGCGNDLACERPMVKKYIIDSILHWARHYHIDGFRFDLMGLMTVDIMNDIQKALDEEFGAGQKIIYGEPWSAGDTSLDYDTPLANKQNLSQLNNQIGIFLDDIRDTVKGSAGQKTSPGFVNGAVGLENNLANCITGWQKVNPNINNPNQVINYLSSHDNQTLWDKLTSTTPYINQRDEQYRLATAINILSQGRIFMLSGSEYCRTKQGDSNSYNSPIEINQLDWNELDEHRDMVDYFRGLINLRSQLTAFLDTSDNAKNRELSRIANNNLVGVELNNQPSSNWQKIFLAFNADSVTRTIPLTGNWQMLANNNDSWLWLDPLYIHNKISIPPLGWLIIGQ